ncbi:MAG: exo-alpha-sialidase [Planctomycetales bacterium]|nr:exo-alpha-sialidase [Planctomycetales bacterium]
MNSRLPFAATLAVVVCCYTSIWAAPPRSQPGVVRSEFIYETAPFPSCHASTLEETPAGIVAAWFGGTHERHEDVGIWVSRRTNAGWSTPVEVANGVQSAELRYPCWNPVLHRAGDGPLTLYYKVGPNPREWWGMAMHSTDNGVTWSPPTRLPEGILGPIKNKPIVLPSGRLLSGSSTEHDGWRVHLEMSDNQGKTWTKTPAINDGQGPGAIQPTLLQTDQDSILMLCRCRRGGRILSAESKDNGNTWTALTAASLPNPNSGIDAVTLADRRHVLIYNHTEDGRSPLNVAVSTNGVDWQAAAVLEEEPGEFSYPAVIQTNDGLVHVTYTWHRKRIKYVVLDPAELELRAITDGRWPDPS